MLTLTTGMLGVFLASISSFSRFLGSDADPDGFITATGAGRTGSTRPSSSSLHLPRLAPHAGGDPTHGVEGRRSTGTVSSAYDLLEHAPQLGTLAPWLFAAFFLAFAIKVPMFPFHTWLPDAHVEAPTAGSVILASILLKMGTYGFLRFAVPFFPEVALSPVVPTIVLVSAVVGIIYGALVAMVQPM
jgi:hypothetical protein